MNGSPLKKSFRTILAGIVAITLLDFLGSIASRLMNFNYAYLTLISIFIYIYFAYIITKKTDRKSAVLFTCLLGVYDSTVGWLLSIVLKANIGNIKIVFSPSMVIFTIFFAIIYAAICGLIGAWLASWRIDSKKK